jgi:S-methylmethionine-dependent homocysteine/selenocysteine methylase
MVDPGISKDQTDEKQPRGRALRDRIASGGPVLLDGATGTELERRGHPAGLPLWSSHALFDAPEAVAAIHAEYLSAGAEILTANTFRTQSRVLARSEAFRGRARELTRQAVALARGAADGRPGRVWVAGSAPPLEDCYRPDRVPDTSSLESEHREHANHLAAAGVDLILVETMNTIVEALAAGRAAAETRLPFWISFVCGNDARLLSGEPLCDALQAVHETGPDVVLVNCLPPSAVIPCLETLAAASCDFGVYANLGANLGAPDPNARDPRREDHEPLAFAVEAQHWVDAGARVIGGCGGTTPAHIRALAESRE